MRQNYPNPSEAPSRRAFLGYSLLASFLVLISGAVYSIFRYLWPIEKKSIASQKGFLTLSLEDIEVGSSQILSFQGKPLIIVRKESRKVFALSAVCTHLACIIRWHNDQKQLICPCHIARFDLFGNVIAGPAPKPLPAFPVYIEENKIIIG